MDMINSIWTRDEIIEAVKPVQVTGGDFTATGVSIDTRSLKSGEVFLALAGENSNGHDYIEMAISKGASAVIIDDIDYLSKYAVPTVLVSNSLDALNHLAKFRRNQSRALFIAITGSVGKTSTKEALYFLLQNFGRSFATRGNYNNHIGVPLSLANMHRDSDYGIFEIGTSNPGEILPLSVMVRPDIAIVTAIAAAHLQNFTNIAQIAEEKLSIIGGLSKNGILFYNGLTCDKYIDKIVGKKVNYTENFSAQSIENSKFEYLTVQYKNHCFEFKNHNRSAIVAQTFLCVLSVCDYLGFNPLQVSQVLNSLQMPKGRGRISNLKILNPKQSRDYYAVDLIDDSYNANPLSMSESIKFATGYAKGQNKNLVLVLGDMLELGKDEIKFHQDLEQSIDSTMGIHLITVGSLMNHLSIKVKETVTTRNYENIGSLENNLFDILVDNSVLLIKGSHSTGLYRLVEQLLKFEISIPKEIEDKNAI